METKSNHISSGIFYVDGRPIYGELNLNGFNTSLFLRDSKFFNVNDTPYCEITGTLNDLRKATFIKCIISQGPGTFSRGDEKYHHLSLYPHIIITGDKHLPSESKEIDSISFYIDEGHKFFYDYDAFGSIHELGDVKLIIEKQFKEKGKFIEVDEMSSIFYFTGRTRIFSVETEIGEMIASHSYSYSPPGITGIGLKNKVMTTVRFKNPISINEAINRIYIFKLFFEYISGSAKDIGGIKIETKTDLDKDPVYLDVYICKDIENFDSKIRPVHVGDVLICGVRNKEEFGEVCAAWVAKHDELSDARYRFRSCFTKANSYDADRIIAAANLFDIIPKNFYSKINSVPLEVRTACEEARIKFASLAQSPQRDSMLSAIGRINSLSLKEKIRQRSDIVNNALIKKFEDIGFVTDCAVDCRNHYVHGSDGKINYKDNFFETVPFLTNALEFVFLSSDLVEAGWDINRWISRGGTLSHPMQRFVFDYKANLKYLRNII